MQIRTQADWIVRAIREPADLPAFVGRPDGTFVRGRVTELSDRGCKLATEAGLAVGERINLDLPGFGRVDGEIRRHTDSNYGVQLMLQDSEEQLSSALITGAPPAAPPE
jgi:hypothetical protein